MWTIAQTSDIITVAKAVGIILASVAAAIVLIIKAWSAIKNRSVNQSIVSNPNGCVECRNKVAAIYRTQKDMKDFLEKEDPNADRPRIYTPRNIEKDFDEINESIKKLEGQVTWMINILNNRLPRGDPTNI